MNNERSENLPEHAEIFVKITVYDLQKQYITYKLYFSYIAVLGSGFLMACFI